MDEYAISKKNLIEYFMYKKPNLVKKIKCFLLIN